MKGFLLAMLLMASASAVAAADKTLDIYFIDVEGGQSTLVVTPAGESLLIDTGYPDRDGRDPDRIMAAMRDAHVTAIDYLLITHMHEDHNGGAAELARRVPIRAFVDYGDLMETGADQVASFAAYNAARAHAVQAGTARHIVPKPGDRLPLKGLDVRVLSADGTTLTRPLDGAGQTNPACVTPPGPARVGFNAENPRSVSVRIRYGAFGFLDLGDLVNAALRGLVCPNNMVGGVDAYLIAHHANTDPNMDAVLSALKPRVAIANNGAYKGGTPATLATLHQHPEIENVWQLHKSLNYESVNFPDEFIANPEYGDADHAAWIKLSAKDDGSFTVTNGRTGWTRAYGRK